MQWHLDRIGTGRSLRASEQRKASKKSLDRRRVRLAFSFPRIVARTCKHYRSTDRTFDGEDRANTERYRRNCHAVLGKKISFLLGECRRTTRPEVPRSSYRGCVSRRVFKKLKEKKRNRAREKKIEKKKQLKRNLRLCLLPGKNSKREIDRYRETSPSRVYSSRLTTLSSPGSKFLLVLFDLCLGRSSWVPCTANPPCTRIVRLDSVKLGTF